MISTGFSFSASIYNHRWIIIVLILFINPFSFIVNAAPIRTNLKFEGLLGCKYDIEICNIHEDCFDDDLFGQCWDGQGFIPDIINGINEKKFIILGYTLDFLNRYHLTWKDYLTQCILADILITDRNRLQSLYEDCLKNDEILNRIANKNVHRRATEYNHPLNYWNSYAPLFPSEHIYLDNPSDGSLFIQFDDRSQLPPAVYVDRVLLGSSENDIDLQRSNPIVEQSDMNEDETLSMDNNKEFLPKLVGGQTLGYNREKNITDAEHYFTVETARGYIVINRDFKDQAEGVELLHRLAQINSWPTILFDEVNTNQRILTYRLADNAYQINADTVARSALYHRNILANQMNLHIIDSGIGNPNQGAQLSVERQNVPRLAIIALLTCALILFLILIFICLYYLKRNERIRQKLTHITRIKRVPTEYYRDLCRQRMQEQTNVRPSPEIHLITPNDDSTQQTSTNTSTRNSFSSWAEEPSMKINMDIMTGHLILSYMEDHLRDRHRLESEWESLCTEETREERITCSIALAEINEKKNRYWNCIPYDHTRIRLENDLDGDYINASKITDSDPRSRYIATQGPMLNTTNAFWQMVWEQGSCLIVALTRPIENGLTMCHHYWPVEGSKQFNDYEVNLVSEHISSDDYVVRNFYLKNNQTMETRTVTQFHFLTWDELSNPPSIQSVLDFRRKVNKCFRGRSSPIIVHCNDGIGRTGTYILLDMVLNRIAKGAREINIAATLEHIRDQRAKMVKTKEQFEFVFVAVAEEVTILLKSLSQ